MKLQAQNHRGKKAARYNLDPGQFRYEAVLCTGRLAHRNASLGFSGGSDSKESAGSAEDLGSIPGLGRSPGEGNGNPFQYSCLENCMDRGAWQAAVQGVTKSWPQLSN